MDMDNLELKEISGDDLVAMMKGHLGDYDSMSVGQEVFVPVADDGNGNSVFFGPLDFSGKSNELSEEEWKKFIEKESGFEPVDKSVFKKSSDTSKVYAFATADSSIGPCNMYAFYPDILTLLKSLIGYEASIFDDEEIKAEAEEITTVEEAISFCDAYFNHSFFTGIVCGPFEYVSGPKPDENGFATK